MKELKNSEIMDVAGVGVCSCYCDPDKKPPFHIGLTISDNDCHTICIFKYYTVDIKYHCTTPAPKKQSASTVAEATTISGWATGGCGNCTVL